MRESEGHSGHEDNLYKGIIYSPTLYSVSLFNAFEQPIISGINYNELAQEYEYHWFQNWGLRYIRIFAIGREIDLNVYCNGMPLNGDRNQASLKVTQHVGAEIFVAPQGYMRNQFSTLRLTGNEFTSSTKEFRGDDMRFTIHGRKNSATRPEIVSLHVAPQRR